MKVEMPDSCTNDVADVLFDVVMELSRAKSKFPETKAISLAVGEEFGELCQAILQQVEKGRASIDVYNEGVQLITTVLRLLVEGDPLFPLYSLAQAVEQGL